MPEIGASSPINQLQARLMLTKEKNTPKQEHNTHTHTHTHTPPAHHRFIDRAIMLLCRQATLCSFSIFRVQKYKYQVSSIDRATYCIIFSGCESINFLCCVPKYCSLEPNSTRKRRLLPAHYNYSPGLTGHPLSPRTDFFSERMDRKLGTELLHNQRRDSVDFYPRKSHVHVIVSWVRPTTTNHPKLLKNPSLPPARNSGSKTAEHTYFYRGETRRFFFFPPPKTRISYKEREREKQEQNPPRAYLEHSHPPVAPPRAVEIYSPSPATSCPVSSRLSCSRRGSFPYPPACCCCYSCCC